MLTLVSHYQETDLLMSQTETKRRKLEDEVEIIDLEEDVGSGTPLANFKCPICLDAPEKLVVTECGHLYCDNCVFHALRSTRHSTKSSGQCSICRKTVRYSNVKYLEMRLAGQGDIKPKAKPKRPKKAKTKEVEAETEPEPTS